MLGGHVGGGAQHDTGLCDADVQCFVRSPSLRVERFGLGTHGSRGIEIDVEGMRGGRGCGRRERDGRGAIVVPIEQAPREAEVHDADVPVGADHHVLGLEVAVNQVLGVCGGQAAAGVGEDLQDLGPGARRGVHPVANRVSVDKLHGDEDVVLEGADVVDRHDVRMRQLGDGLRLAHQSDAPVAVAARA